MGVSIECESLAPIEGRVPGRVLRYIGMKYMKYIRT